MPHRILNVAEHGMLDAYEAELKALPEHRA